MKKLKELEKQNEGKRYKSYFLSYNEKENNYKDSFLVEDIGKRWKGKGKFYYDDKLIYDGEIAEGKFKSYR